MTGPDPRAPGDGIDRTQAYKPEGAGAEPPPLNLPKIPGITLHFEIARGGMGVVYSGRQDFLDRRVAVKFLAVELGGEKFAQRFRREAKILAGIKHPNIVACHSAGTTDDGQSYLVMEFVDGPNLKSWIGEHGPLTCGAALRMTRAVAQALAHALALGVIHRDVKPENILLETMTSTALDVAFPFTPKLVDLGLARMTYETAGLGLTSPGSVMGTPSTMSPEQFDEPDSVDFRSDIYGLGCALYEMLVGQPAYRGRKLTDIVTKKREPVGPNPCAENPLVPMAIGELVSEMLSSNRDARPPSYKVLDERLAMLLDGLPAGMGKPPVFGQAPSVPRPDEVTGATIAGGGPFSGRAPTNSVGTMTPPPTDGPPATPSQPPQGKTGPGLLRTAEIDFLSAGLGGNEPSRPAFRETPSGVAPSSVFPATPTNVPASNTPSNPGVPATVPGATAAPIPVVTATLVPSPAAAGKRTGLYAAVAVLVLAGGAVAFFATRGGGEGTQTNGGKPVDVPTAANKAPERAATTGPSTIELGKRFELEVSALDPDGDRLSYSWTSNDLVLEGSATTGKVIYRALDGLPGADLEAKAVVTDAKGASTEAVYRVKVADFPAKNALVSFKNDSIWNLDRKDPLGWREVGLQGQPRYAAVMAKENEPRSMWTSLGGDVFWEWSGHLQSDSVGPGKPFGKTGVRLELGDRGWTVLCKRSGDRGGRWTVELLAAVREQDKWREEPLPQPKVVEWDESASSSDVSFASFRLERRRGTLTLQIGRAVKIEDQYPINALGDSVRHVVDIDAVEPRLTVFVEDGRGTMHIEKR